MDPQSPLFRWGVGLSGGALLAIIALQFFEGTMQLVLLVFAVVDAAFTPLFLKYAMQP